MKKGFTLIELLVVVLIIGILAAIAVPQYQLSIGKSKFTTIKNLTRSLAEDAEAYHLANGYYPSTLKNLDISVPSLNDGYCYIYYQKDQQNAIFCALKINKKEIRYYRYLKYDQSGRGGTAGCVAMSTDKKDLVNQICKQETNRKETCRDSYCFYHY